MLAKIKIKITLVAAACLVAIIMPSTALALTGGGVGIRPATPRPPAAEPHPSWFIYEVDPGTVIQDAVHINNTRDDSVVVKLEGLDALLTLDGAFGLTDDESTNKDIGTWIELSEKEFTILPRTEKTVPFTVTVPPEAEVGDHMGGIVIYKSAATPDKTIKSGGATVNIVTRVGVRMYLTVKGDIVRNLRLLGRSFYGQKSQMRFRFKWENRGNIRANLEASGKIYGIFGTYDQRENFTLGQVFPNKTVSQDIAWPGKNRPAFGPYLAIVDVKDVYKSLNPDSTIPPPPDKTIRIWLFAFFIPYTQAAVVIGILFLIWFIYQLTAWKRLTNLARRPVITYKVKKGDSLTGIANQLGASWKLVAKLNHLKAPYSLEGITTLYIPDAGGSQMDIDMPHFLAFAIRPFIRTARRQPKEEIIVVEKNDTKRDIEEFTGLTWRTIAKHNSLKSTAKIQPGQELRIPKKQRRQK